jgi:2-polyprenyl-3-methyl-5-hydroxy-6-metoxy-1,4-benzoquinol methylase
MRWRLIGVDISAARCTATARLVPRAAVVCADVAKTCLPNQSVDVVICSQVIEHLPDRKALIREIERILKPQGMTFLASVSKKPWAIYFYRNRGRFVVDPTHLIEYSSLDHFIRDVETEQLVVTARASRQLTYPISDLLLRGLERLRLLSGNAAREAYVRSRLLRLIAKLSLPVPGYRVVEAVLVRRP